MKRLVMTLCVVGTVAAGCSSGDEGAAEAVPAASPPAAVAVETAAPPADAATPAAPASAPPAGGGSEPAAAASESAVTGASEELGGQEFTDRHPNGLQLTVDRITVDSTTMSVDVTAVNGFTDQVELNTIGLFLVDDLGNGYNFSEPTTNGDLAIDPGAELTGTLVFLGRIDPDATSLTLKTNVFNPDDHIDVANRFDLDRSPKMQIETIPVPA